MAAKTLSKINCFYCHIRTLSVLCQKRACVRVKTCRVRVLTLFPEVPWRVTYSTKNITDITINGQSATFVLVTSID